MIFNLSKTFSTLFNITLTGLKAIIECITLVYRNVFSIFKSQDILKHRLSKAQNYEEWKEIAREIDIEQNAEEWRSDPTSNLYDYKLIESRLKHLRQYFENKDVSSVIHLLRSGLLRNLGGISDARLFEKSLCGTKNLIEEYQDEVLKQLDFICNRNDLNLSRQWDFIRDVTLSLLISKYLLLLRLDKYLDEQL